MLTRAIPMMLVATAAGIFISSANTKKQDNDVNVLPFVIPLAALSIGVGLYRGVNRQKALFDSYTLTITNNLVIREQLNTPTISIYYNDVAKIAKQKNGDFIIRGKDASDLIIVPSQIDNYSQLEEALQSIQPIAVNERMPFLQRYQSFTGLATVGLMLCVYTVNNKIVVALAGTLLITVIIWSIVNIRSNKNVDNKTREISWLLLLVLASVIAVIVFKLTGMMNLQS